MGLTPVQTTHLRGGLNGSFQFRIFCGSLKCSVLQDCLKFKLYLIYKILILSDVITFSFKNTFNNALGAKLIKLIPIPIAQKKIAFPSEKARTDV